MLKHAAWLAEEARRYVNIQSWKDFAKTGILNLDEDPDIEMDELEIDRLVRPTPSSPATLTLSPGHKRVRPFAQLQNTTYSSPSYFQPESVNSRSSLEYASDDQPFDRESERESSPERSPSPPLVDPYVAMRVPIAFQYTPRVPDNFHWWCDIEGCHYNIYLLNLTRENLGMLDGMTTAKLRLQDWSLSDPWVQLAFKTMVEDHRVKHLESWGLRCLRGPSGVRRSSSSTSPDPSTNDPRVLGPRTH